MYTAIHSHKGVAQQSLPHRVQDDQLRTNFTPLPIQFKVWRALWCHFNVEAQLQITLRRIYERLVIANSVFIDDLHRTLNQLTIESDYLYCIQCGLNWNWTDDHLRLKIMIKLSIKTFDCHRLTLSQRSRVSHCGNNTCSAACRI